MELYKLPDNSSIFTAELYALYMSTEKLKCTSNDDFVICSDSISAIKSLKSVCQGIREESIGLETIRNCLPTNKKVTFQWIPSHVGIRHNEEVDKLTKHCE
jgi:ribonuclease HI